MVTDATLVGSLHADGTVLTVRAGQALREEAQSCHDRLRLAGVKVLGAVVNAYRPTGGRAGKDYAYYAAYATEGEPEVGSAA
jgi:Mrp family chromosome partitioning ATPase